MQPNPRRRFGATMVEAAIAIVIVGVMAVAALRTLGGAARTRQAVARQHHGDLLARQLIGEIGQAPYVDPEDGGGGGGGGGDDDSDDDGPTSDLGPEYGEGGPGRDEFDDVDDYDGWSASPPVARDGVALDGYTGWRRQVWVDYVSVNNPWGGTYYSDTGLKRITVRVTDPSGVRTELSALRANLSGLHDYPFLPESYTSWIGAEAQSGNDERARLHGGAMRLNRLPE